MEDRPQVKVLGTAGGVGGLANVCCLAGTLLVIYGAFLLHSSVGCLVSGAGLIAYGVIRHRKPVDSGTKRR